MKVIAPIVFLTHLIPPYDNKLSDRVYPDRSQDFPKEPGAQRAHTWWSVGVHE
jgi:hypothetical protein